jgi:hypothetical protein
MELLWMKTAGMTTKTHKASNCTELEHNSSTDCRERLRKNWQEQRLGLRKSGKNELIIENSVEYISN